MTKHIWASPALPTWYVIDQFEERMTSALGQDWASKNIEIGSMSFLDDTGSRYPMSAQINKETMAGGTLWNLMQQARHEGVKQVALYLDVHIMDAQ